MTKWIEVNWELDLLSVGRRIRVIIYTAVLTVGNGTDSVVVIHVVKRGNRKLLYVKLVTGSTLSLKHTALGQRGGGFHFPCAVLMNVLHTNKELREGVDGELDRGDSTAYSVNLNNGQRMILVNLTVICKLFNRSVVQLMVDYEIAVPMRGVHRDSNYQTHDVVVGIQIGNADVHQFYAIDGVNSFSACPY